jgi:NAD(P)-dependent dehydrogenase (short-subunit alcohol dehydrogenase family)
MAQKLIGKVAVITGAGSQAGIGKEVALAMAAEGAKVVVNDIARDPDGTSGADRVVEEIRKAKGTAVANYDSVATMAGAQNIIKTAISNFGRIDILLNAAGNFLIKPTVDYTEAEWDAVMDVHLKGYFGCTQAALREMMKQKSGGRIINIASNAAFTPGLGPGPAIAYCAAKAGVLGFTWMLSLEMKEHGITVNAITPVAVTGLFPIPGRVVDGVQMFGPEFVAPIIVYLATDEAKDITGQIIYSGSGDLCIYALPLKTPGPHQYLHKMGKWTVDELVEIMPRMVGVEGKS